MISDAELMVEHGTNLPPEFVRGFDVAQERLVDIIKKSNSALSKVNFPDLKKSFEHPLVTGYFKRMNCGSPATLLFGMVPLTAPPQTFRYAVSVDESGIALFAGNLGIRQYLITIDGSLDYVFSAEEPFPGNISPAHYSLRGEFPKTHLGEMSRLGDNVGEFAMHAHPSITSYYAQRIGALYLAHISQLRQKDGQ